MKQFTCRLSKGAVFVTWIGVVLILIFSCRGTWGYISADGNPYRHQHVLDSQGRYHLQWTVDSVEKRISFNVTVETRGYVGFGLSDGGKMTGADIVIGGMFPDGEVYFSDRHAVGTQVPEEDPQQDWRLDGIWENMTHTSLSFFRDWDTCDPQDYPITADKVTILWAYGERDEIVYHYRNRGSYNVNLLNPNYSPRLEMNSQSRTPTAQDPFTGENYQVWSINTSIDLPSSSDTVYWCTMHKAPSLLTKHHVVGTNVRFGDPQSKSAVYHVSVYKCHPPLEQVITNIFSPFVENRGQQCFNPRNPLGTMPTEYCTELFMVWAIGGREFFHPPHVGIPFGTFSDEYYLVKVHYNKANLAVGRRITWAMDFFYTSNLRPNDAGLLNVGHTSPGRSPSLLIPPSSIEHDVVAICGTHCTREMLPKLGIHVYAVLLHTHNSGRKMKIHQFRQTRELPWMVAEENFAYNYQQYMMLPEERTVLPWDSLALRCTYDNTWTNGTVVGGFSARQEMCSAFLFYYNKIPEYQECSSEIGSPEARSRFLGFRNITWSNSQMEFLVNDTNHPWWGMPVSRVSDMYGNWTLEQRREIQKWQLKSQHVNWCFPEVYAGGPINPPETELIPPPRKRQKQPSLSPGRKRRRRQLSPTQIPKYEPEWEDPRRYSHFPTNIKPYKPPKRNCSS